MCSQSFDVYHPTEAVELDRQFREHPITDRQTWYEFAQRANVAGWNAIRFTPESVLREYTPVDDVPYLIYHAGYTIL